MQPEHTPTDTATACGKIILLGEHAVVYGVPALCGALAQGIRISLSPGEGRLRIPAWQVETASAHALFADADLAAQASTSVAAAFAAILRSLATGSSQRRPFADLQHDFVADFSIPTGAGLGSSAALAVALSRAVGLALGTPFSPAQIDAAAFAAEQVFHGHPSGLDHTVAQHGGFGLFRRGQGLVPLTGLPPLKLCVGHTGRARDTKSRVARVAELYQQNPQEIGACFARIESLVHAAVAALRQQDLVAFGSAMTENQRLLATIEVSCPEIESMCDLALAAGALGCKLTGGGGGGCVVAIAPGREPSLLAAWQEAGYTAFPVEIRT